MGSVGKRTFWMRFLAFPLLIMQDISFSFFPPTLLSRFQNVYFRLKAIVRGLKRKIKI